MGFKDEREKKQTASDREMNIVEEYIEEQEVKEQLSHSNICKI